VLDGVLPGKVGRRLPRSLAGRPVSGLVHLDHKFAITVPDGHDDAADLPAASFADEQRAAGVIVWAGEFVPLPICQGGHNFGRH
jgi:hypothetical protein